jgi:hypothetical protein
VVSGQQKLVQDLKCAILEPRGTDPMHPSFGSTLDGGTLPDGSTVGTNIGEAIDRERLMEIESELRRVILDHQAKQIDRLQREALLYGGKNTFTAGELIQSVERIDILPVQDVVIARVFLLTQAGSRIQLMQPV